MWNAGCGFWDKDILAGVAYAQFNQEVRDKFDIKGRDRCWDEKNKRELKRSQRRDGAHMRRFFREVYVDSVFPILNSAELPPYIWGNDEREKERHLWILNHCEKRTALESLLSPDRLYKPFNVDRFTLDLSKLAAT
ncbi:nephrocystin-1-like [Orbicella faveolata]|uniref:nephrocystin-1-like n=1 Tax=Orbicella faveolata TaxID=48498 RepID=UPI0009E63D62|nr:nephrocystin-1-like [Orbicella faveolata]